MNILHEKYKRLNTLYKQYETSIDDLQDALVEQLPQLKEEFDLDFVQVERLRNYIEDRGREIPIEREYGCRMSSHNDYL